MLTVGYGETGRLGHGDEEDVVQPKVTIAPVCFFLFPGGSQGVHVLVVRVALWFGRYEQETGAR